MTWKHFKRLNALLQSFRNNSFVWLKINYVVEHALASPNICYVIILLKLDACKAFTRASLITYWTTHNLTKSQPISNTIVASSHRWPTQVAIVTQAYTFVDTSIDRIRRRRLGLPQVVYKKYLQSFKSAATRNSKLVFSVVFLSGAGFLLFWLFPKMKMVTVCDDSFLCVLFDRINFWQSLVLQIADGVNCKLATHWYVWASCWRFLVTCYLAFSSKSRKRPWCRFRSPLWNEQTVVPGWDGSGNIHFVLFRDGGRVVYLVIQGSLLELVLRTFQGPRLQRKQVSYFCPLGKIHREPRKCCLFSNFVLF